jgi:eukaryotic-like serine/threonine-protein kinase
MARVYLAESLGSGIQKLVVLKILNQELARDATVRAAFLREALISGRMNHRNVVQVYEVLEHRTTDVIVMEYIDGLPLSRIVQDNAGMLSVRLHLSIVLQMLAGLHYFHELADLDGSPLAGVHRDISPHNVLVSHDGQAKVADFGIAKINAPTQGATQTGRVKGKVHYMSPEQISMDEVDRRTDVFAAGVLLWEAVAQRRMWHGRSLPQVMRALSEGHVPLLAKSVPDAPLPLLEVATRATKANPKERYGTALEMLEATERAMAETTGIAPPREISEFMASAFGEIRTLQQQSVNQALRHPDVAPLGILDCWTASHAVQGHPSKSPRRDQLRFDTPIGVSEDLADSSFINGEASATSATFLGQLPNLTSATATVVGPGLAAPAPPGRRTLKTRLAWIAGVALVLGGAAWLPPLGARAKSEPATPAVATPKGMSSEQAAPPAPPSAAAATPSVRDLTVAKPELTRSDEERDLDRAPATRRPRAPHRPSIAPARPVASAAAADCSPPYRILANGLKRYKLECFAK